MRKLIFILFFSTISCFSQAPGFLGRKFYFLGGGSFDIAFSNPTDYRITNKSIGSYGINTRWEGSLNFAAWKKTSIGLDFHYINTAFIVPVNYASYNGSQLYATNGSLACYFWGVNAKFFFGNNLAPVGPYVKVEAGGVYFDANIYKLDMSGPSRRIETGSFYGMVSVGRQHIFFRRLMLDYGMQFGFTGTEAVFNRLLSGYSDHYTDEDAAIGFKLRTFEHTLFNFYAGVGMVF